MSNTLFDNNGGVINPDIFAFIPDQRNPNATPLLKLEVAETTTGWVYGYGIMLGECGTFNSASIYGQRYPDRKAAVDAVIAHTRDWCNYQKRKSEYDSVRKRADRVLAELDKLSLPKQAALFQPPTQQSLF